MSAANYTLHIDRGSDFFLSFIVKDGERNPIDLTGSTVSGQIRSIIESTTKYDLTVELSDTPTDGTVNVSLTAAETEALPVNASRSSARQLTYYCYDIVLTKADGKIIRVLQGQVAVSPEVTR